MFRSKSPPLDILKLFFATFRNKDNKVSFILVVEDGALETSSEFMKTCHNMNIIVHTTGEYSYSLNGKIESPNNTLDNITRALLLNSSYRK